MRYQSCLKMVQTDGEGTPCALGPPEVLDKKENYPRETAIHSIWVDR